MGKKGSWLSSIKKALSPNSKKSKKKGLGDEKSSVSVPKSVGESRDSPSLPPPEEVKPVGVENEQMKNAYSAATADTTRLTDLARYSGKSKEELSSIRIQTAFRGYLARRALRALRGLVRLKTLVDGPTANRQTANTLKCIQNVSRVQCQINSRRIRMSEENQALQRQLLQKQAKELENLQMGEEWNASLQSKEQIEAKLLSKYEATMRRERALAYSFSHQQPWKKSARSTNLLFSDPTNPQWGWSWLERYMSGKTSDTRAEKDHTSLKTTINITAIEIAKSYASRPMCDLPKALQKPKKGARDPIASRKFKRDDDSTSVFSIKSEINRRNSIAGSSVRDDESIDSSISVPSYMAQTKSAKAKSKRQSMLGPAENGGLAKRLSFPGSPVRPRRHSGPPKLQTTVSMAI